MRFVSSLLGLILAAVTQPLAGQEERSRIFASEPSKYAVTVYRDPERSVGERMDRDMPKGYAMISETRTVTLPPGRSTIMFEGVAEGMVAVSAIVSGLPGGTIEKNRNADLLSPAALVDRTLGNRVTITRLNPGTGVSESETAIVRTRADGGLVLQTRDGYEAVRCSGLSEKLTFASVPRELSARPIFNIDTFSETGGKFEVVLTYLSWGFDWEANYVAHLGEGNRDGSFDTQLMSWLTVLNDNGQSFPDAELMVVAGQISIESNFEELATAPRARGLRLTCYPLGGTARGSPIYGDGLPRPEASPLEGSNADVIVVTGRRVSRQNLESPVPVSAISEEAMAREEQLADLKLYRVPRPVTVSSNGMKQIAFLSRDHVSTRWFYDAECDPMERFERSDEKNDLEYAQIRLLTENTREFGLGVSLPLGILNAFETSSAVPQLVAETQLRDYPVGQQIELPLGSSAKVFSVCGYQESAPPGVHASRWTKVRVVLANANDTPAQIRVDFGYPDEWEVRAHGFVPHVKNGKLVVHVKVPANGRFERDWLIRRPKAYSIDPK